MMKNKISPSIMCADFFKLDEYIEVFEKNNIEMIHVDIMDGNFVPNYTLGTDFVKALKNKTDIPLDIHLMIENPEDKLDWFEFGPEDYVSVHCESTAHLHKAISMIKKKGAKAMVAVNPATSEELPKCLLDEIDAILVMTVDPGFAGQKVIPTCINKIANLKKYLKDNGYENIEIEVDGNVSFENAEKMKNAGANIFVAGTSSVFGKESSMDENISKFRTIINN